LKDKVILVKILENIKTKISYTQGSQKHNHFFNLFSSSIITKEDLLNKLTEISQKWDVVVHNPAIPNDQAASNKAHLRWKSAVEKAKVLGAGLRDANAKILQKMYWLEVLDFNINGKTVYLYANVLVPYFEQWKQDLTEKRDFKIYMQEIINGMDKQQLKYLENNGLLRLNEEQRKECEVSFDGKGLILKNQQPVEDGEYIFVLEAKLGLPRLYINKKIKGKFQHSSFFAGGAVRSAGMMQVENGIIRLIKPHSGHYTPTNEMMIPVLDFIELKGGKEARDKVKMERLHPLILKIQPRLFNILIRLGLM
jgi:hypothetical protein